MTDATDLVALGDVRVIAVMTVALIAALAISVFRKENDDD